MKVMNISDDGQWVVIDRENGMSPEELALDEFIAIYGHSPLEEIATLEMNELTPVELYWAAFIDLCDTVGKIKAWRAIAKNAADGVLPVQKVVHKYFGHDSLNVEQAIAYAEAHLKKSIRDLEKVGSKYFSLKPFSDRDRENLLEILENDRRRNYIRDWSRKYLEMGEVLSARELVIQSYRKQKSLWPESWKKTGCPY